jgi:iron complex outermembrane receptor protein
MRRIRYDNSSNINVRGETLSDEESRWFDTIYSASIKQQFTDNFMGYFSYGSSWRPGINVVGDFSDNKTPLENSFLNLAPETSDSYEIGFKSNWLDSTLRVNVAAFYQEFENYPYRVGGDGVYYILEEAGVQSVDQFNFVGAVPVNVKGIELETFYQINDSWDVGLLASWSKGEIDGGTVPCNAYGTSSPSVGNISAATGGDHLASCEVDYRSNNAPLWTATLQSEYSFPVAELEGYVRGMVTFFGDSENDPANAFDDVKAYNLANLYLGLREPSGKWEVMLYGKNLLDTERVISREATPYLVGYRDAAAGMAEVQRTSDYRGISMTAPREFGVNVRFNF